MNDLLGGAATCSIAKPAVSKMAATKNTYDKLSIAKRDGMPALLADAGATISGTSSSDTMRFSPITWIRGSSSVTKEEFICKTHANQGQNSEEEGSNKTLNIFQNKKTRRPAAGCCPILRRVRRGGWMN